MGIAARIVPAAGAVAGAVADALFPPSCPACGTETSTGRSLCAECWAATSFLSANGCVTCGREIPGLGDLPGAAPHGVRCGSCQAHPPLWDRGAAVLAYDGTGRRLALALKHGDRLDMLPMLGGWMLRAGGGLLGDADLILPVPMHWTRRLKRRFNQSAELALAAARAAGRSPAFAPGLLRRVRRTPSQDGRDRAARAENLKGAFALAPGAAARISGRRVLLVDDVLTTGATLNGCAALCRGAGAAGVDILALALVSFNEAPYLRSP